MVKRRRAKRTKSKKDASKAANRKALWKAYKSLHQRAERAWRKFKSDVKKQANPAVLLRDQRSLLLLLGECNYMARECKRLASKQKKASRR